MALDPLDFKNWIHVLHGKLICYEPGLFDENCPEDVEWLDDFAKRLYVHPFLQTVYGENSYVLIEQLSDGSLHSSIADLTCLPDDFQRDLRGASDEYRSRTGRMFFDEVEE